MRIIRTRARPSKKIKPSMQRAAGISQRGEEFFIFVQNSESESPLVWKSPAIVRMDKQSVKIAHRTIFFIEKRLYQFVIIKEIGEEIPGQF